MQRKTVIFIADSLDNAHKFQQVLSKLDVDVAAGSSVQFKRLLAAHPVHDLVIYEARGDNLGAVSSVESALAEEGSTAMLVIVNEDQLAEFRLPVSCKADFVVHGASAAECTQRIRQLLWPGNEGSSADYIVVDAMTVNLATYQVKVAGEPVDLTYLEYALLAFLVTHPGRTYSRDALLRRPPGQERGQNAIPAAIRFLFCRAALGDGGGIEITDVSGGHPTKKTAVQCGVQKAHAVQFTVNGIAGF